MGKFLQIWYNLHVSVFVHELQEDGQTMKSNVIGILTKHVRM